jgi:hypothetical protein
MKLRLGYATTNSPVPCFKPFYASGAARSGDCQPPFRQRDGVEPLRRTTQQLITRQPHVNAQS